MSARQDGSSIVDTVCAGQDQRRKQRHRLPRHAFEAAYDAAFFVALAVLNAEGWKSRSVEGHHVFVLEAGCAAAGAGVATFDRLDAMRDVRNQKYAGIERTEADLRDALAALEGFSNIAVQWLQANHAALLKQGL